MVSEDRSRLLGSYSPECPAGDVRCEFVYDRASAKRARLLHHDGIDSDHLTQGVAGRFVYDVKGGARPRSPERVAPIVDHLEAEVIIDAAIGEYSPCLRSSTLGYR